MADFTYTDLLPLGADTTPYRLLTTEGVELVDGPDGTQFLKVSEEALELLAETAFSDISFFLRPQHLAQMRAILDDPEASENDKFVALDLLHNSNIAAGRVLPMCQDTGTGIVKAHRGKHVLTPSQDEVAITKGLYEAFDKLNLRYSQNAPLTMWDEKNTGNNLPGQIEIFADTSAGHELEYEFLFILKGGGSANKSFLYQETKAILNPESMMKFLEEKLRAIGTAACPPYHIGIVIGGTSAEYTLAASKLASVHYLDNLPTTGSESGHGFRDLDLEAEVLELSQRLGIGAQFGGKYFAHDIRVIRLPRHGASLPVGISVSCSADRQAIGKITADGVFLEQLEEQPAHYLPEVHEEELDGTDIVIDLTRPMDEIRAQLSQYPVKTRVSLNGTIIVARDIAHAKIKALLDSGEPMPQYLKDHPVYYAGPAKTPEGMPSGSFGPTTAGRMDSYVDLFQAQGGSMVMLAKGNRSKQVTDACEKHGGFYLGSIGGPAARLAQDCIKKVELLEYPELGMEAIWRIEVQDFPAFIIVDDKGNDLYAQINSQPLLQVKMRDGL